MSVSKQASPLVLQSRPVPSATAHPHFLRPNPQFAPKLLVKFKKCEHDVEVGLFYITLGRGVSWLEGRVPLDGLTESFGAAW